MIGSLGKLISDSRHLDGPDESHGLDAEKEQDLSSCIPSMCARSQ